MRTQSMFRSSVATLEQVLAAYDRCEVRLSGLGHESTASGRHCVWCKVDLTGEVRVPVAALAAAFLGVTDVDALLRFNDLAVKTPFDVDVRVERLREALRRARRASCDAQEHETEEGEAACLDCHPELVPVLALRS